MDFPVTETFKDTANVAQLHDEARRSKQVWPASLVQTENGWVYRVDRDDIDTTVVQAALDAHTPDPDYGKDHDEITARDGIRNDFITVRDNLTTNWASLAAGAKMEAVRAGVILCLRVVRFIAKGSLGV